MGFFLKVLPSKGFLILLLKLYIFLPVACGNDDTLVTEEPSATVPDLLKEVPEVESTFFSNVYVEQSSSYDVPSDGDLWTSTWSDDDELYVANGDGKGFNLDGGWADIVLNKVYGHPEDQNINGTRIASGNELGPVWGSRVTFNRKPTGMVSVNGILYMAVQDLVSGGPNIFNEAPAATILRSDDKGENWQWEAEEPMFGNHIFTTIFFLDFGKDGQNNNFDNYVYAYGMDHNWRDSFSNIVPDPTELYLARIPKDGIPNLGTWEFYTGDLLGNSSWSAPGNISARKPVLKDERRRYETVQVEPNNLSVISQGSVVYNKSLDRYIYTSWTEYTFEFYESPNPWGPWKLFLSKDFGRYPWTEENFGGYATVIPSKFIGEDGTKMWVSSSTFVGGVKHYNFSLRQLWVTPFQSSTPQNEAENVNLALSEDVREVTPISSGKVRGGTAKVLNDGITNQTIDSYGGEPDLNDYWGYTFNRAYNFNQLVYITGKINQVQGGWFKDIRIQVRQNFEWKDVSVDEMEISPVYSLDGRVESYTAYTFAFEEEWGDGIRVIGRPGGTERYTSIAELEIYYN